MSFNSRPTELSQNFYAEFNLAASKISQAISSDIEAVSSAQAKPNATPGGQSPSTGLKEGSIKKHLTDVAELQRHVQDAAEYSNKHDQRIYAEGVRKLQDQIENLRGLTKPKGKFSFKSSRKAAGAGTGVSAGVSASAPGANPTVRTESTTAVPVKAENNILDNNSVSSIRQSIRISAKHIESSTAATLQNVQQSVIYFREPSSSQSSFPGLHVTDIEQSLIFCGRTSGGLHISRVRSSVLIATTHQFRMHQCSDVIVYLAAGSMPIIENCENLKFAPLLEGCFTAGISLLGGNKWDSVLDFQFPGMTGPTQNWARLEEAARSSLDMNNDGDPTVSGQSVAAIRTVRALRQVLESMGLDKALTVANSETDDVALIAREVPGT